MKIEISIPDEGIMASVTIDGKLYEVPLDVVFTSTFPDTTKEQILASAQKCWIYNVTNYIRNLYL